MIKETPIPRPESLYTSLSYDPENLKYLEPLNDIKGRDFWYRGAENHQNHWAVIHEVNEKEFRVLFFFETSQVVDELVFESLIDAEQALIGFLFDLWEYDNETWKKNHPRPELPLFINRKHQPFPIPELYSSRERSKFPTYQHLSDMYGKGAAEMLRKPFKITGLFYKQCSNTYRKYLDIKRNSDSEMTNPELMVVMMNPGSSEPKNGVYNNIKPSEVEVDPTIVQILRVMRGAALSYVRIINLSDRKMPKSADFYKFLKSPNSNDFPHSIFDPRRKEELAELFIDDVPVIYAWGVDTRLKVLSELAIKAINQEHPIGKKKKGTTSSYYHALPRNQNDKKEWVNTVTGMLRVQHGLA